MSTLTTDALRATPLFAGLDDATLALLAAELPTSMVEPGVEVIRENEPAEEMYVILAGEIEVVKRSRRGFEVRVAMLGPGDWFGEMGILDVQVRSATVRSVAPTFLLRLNRPLVRHLLIERDPASYACVLENVARELSRRLRVADGIVAEFVTMVTDAYANPGPREEPEAPRTSVVNPRKD